MHRPAPGGENGKRGAGHRIGAIHAHLDGAGRGLGGASAARPEAVPEDPPRLPGTQVRELLRERLGVAGQLEGLERQDRGRRVVAVRPARLRRKARDHDIRAERPYHPHNIGEHLLVVPLREGLPVILRIAEVARAAEELAAPVDRPRGQELLGADDAEQIAKLGADHVLAAVPAGERQVRGPVVPAPGKVGDQLRVLVVGMRRDVEDAPEHAEAAQLLLDGGGRRARRGLRRSAQSTRKGPRTPPHRRRASGRIADSGLRSGGRVRITSGWR